MRRTRRLTSSIVGLGSGLLLVGCAPESVENLTENTAQTNQAISQGLAAEVEPNNSVATATPIGRDTVVRANIFQTGTDVDYFAFQGTAGDKVYAATITTTSPSSTDSTLALIAPDGTTVIETDADDGSFSATSSSIAGAALTQTGTHYLRVVQATAGSTIRPYDLHVRVQSGTPVPETEPNDMAPNALPASGWVSGTISSVTDFDPFTITVNAGDTIFASLDLDPLRDNTQWNGQLLIGPFGPGNTFLVANDPSTTAANSEAFPITFKNAGTYAVVVAAPTGVATVGDYNLSVSVHPATAEGVNCTTYTSTDIPKPIPDSPGQVSSTITIPGNPRIADIDVSLNLTHTLPQDLDITLTSPAGNTNAIATDIGGGAGTTFTTWDVTFDDEAAITPLFQVVSGMHYQPRVPMRLHWYDGENAGGTWTLNLLDDTATNTGTLNSWSITICERPPAPTCAGGGALQTVFSTDFEMGAAGFTHSGTQDEWAIGNPTSPPVTGCNSGAICWKTDLANTYNANSSQNLLSPPIDLTNRVGPIQLQWAMKYQMESATFDHAWVEVREVGGANPKRVWEFKDGTMTAAVGSASTLIQQSAGWGVFTADISSFAGKQIEVQFHLDSDGGGQYPGLAIDDVSVSGCAANVCGDGILGPGEACDDGNTANGDCCSSTCQFEAAGTVCRAATNACDVAETCSGNSGTCPVNANAADGTSCTDGNACTQNDTCLAGACTPGSAVTCVASDQCHVAGVCDPMTGMCSNPNATDGTSCSDGNGCTQNDTCQTGTCMAGAPVTCTALDQCHVAGVCDPMTGMCSNPNAADGSACSDNDACTQMDSCQVGVCVGANPVMCAALDQCHVAGVCDPMTGMCSNPNAADGSVCTDNDACTQSDTCQTGACVGANPVMCAAMDQCHVAGSCDPMTGACSNPNAADGTTCNDGSACTQSDTCQTGACVGANPVMCTAMDQCHVVGVCDGATGTCSNPNAPDGQTCDDNDLCTTMDSCAGGACTGTPVTCDATECRDAGMCDKATGLCDGAAKPDGTPCGVDGACQAGTCVNGTGGAGGAAGAGGNGGGGNGGGGNGGGGMGGAGGTGGAASSSSSGSAGMGGVGGEGGKGGETGGIITAGGGCVCTTVGTTESSKSSFVALFGIFGLLAAKLRRRK